MRLIPSCRLGEGIGEGRCAVTPAITTPAFLRPSLECKWGSHGSPQYRVLIFGMGRGIAPAEQLGRPSGSNWSGVTDGPDYGPGPRRLRRPRRLPIVRPQSAAAGELACVGQRVGQPNESVCLRLVRSASERVRRAPAPAQVLMYGAVGTSRRQVACLEHQSRTVSVNSAGSWPCIEWPIFSKDR